MKIKVNGNVVVLESTLKMDDLFKVFKYRREALSIKGGKDNEQVLFTVMPAAVGHDGLNDKVAFFAPALNGKASITISDIPAAAKVNDETLKGYIADTIGSAKGYVELLEASLPAVVEEIDAQRNAMMASIDMGGDETAAETAAE